MNVQLKQEQEDAVRALLDGKNVLAALPTSFGKSLIYQMFIHSMDYKLDGQVAILVISPLISIIKDQMSEIKSLGYSAVAPSHLSLSEIHQCNFKVMFLRESQRERVQGNPP